MARKSKLPTVAEPRTSGGESISPTVDFGPDFRPDVVRMDPLLYSDPPVQQPVRVMTGVNVLTQQPVYKDVVSKDEPLWNTPDRKKYIAHTEIDGSVNRRKINLKRGSVVYLNELEASVFERYVSEAPDG